MEAHGKDLPRTVWFLWFQGLENAPYVVRKCHESWVTRNPGWQVVFLDDASLPSVTSMDHYAGSLATLSRNHRADLVRLDLLAKHGGVWADATSFCVRSLDDWLLQNLESGFFAFHRPRPDRVLSSWFLAAEPGNVLVTRLFVFMRDYWSSHPFGAERDRLAGRMLKRLLDVSPRTRAWWFSPAIRDRLALSPYYALHYAFEKLVREDPECGRVWDRTPKMSATTPHRLYRAGLLSPASAAIRTEIDRREVPVYKTTWDLKQATIPHGSVLGYLLDG